MNRVFFALAGGCVGGTALAQFGDWFWLGELASHFPVQALIAAFVALPIMARDGRYGWVVVLLVAAALNARPLLPYADVGATMGANDGQPDSQAGAIQFAAVNLLGSNRNTNGFGRWLAADGPDVVALAELSSHHIEELERLSAAYPGKHFQPRDDNFGIGIMSRFPILASEHFLLAGVTPAIAAEIQTPGGSVEVIAVHLQPPITPSMAAARNEQLAALAARSAKRRHPLVILGDFNTTPYSPKLRRLIADGDLADTALGRGISYTWPRGIPLFRIPIDLCLVSKEFEVLGQRLGPPIGSDHWPLVTDLRL